MVKIGSWKKLAVDIYKMILDELPYFEMYEQGRQIRKITKSVAANRLCGEIRNSFIVEGYGGRRHKN
ncbi:MAG: hypothetical protein ACE5PV_03850 [Candidatus Poribacteria bacterium]